MYYDLNILEGTGIQFLKHQFLIQISYWVNLKPRICAIAEWLTTCRYSGFWQNKHVSSCFTMLVTVSKGRLDVCTCATVWNIKSPNDNVRGGGGNWRGIIYE